MKESRLGEETRRGDKERRLGEERRRGDQEKRLGEETRRGDQERRLGEELSPLSGRRAAFQQQYPPAPQPPTLRCRPPSVPRLRTRRRSEPPVLSRGPGLGDRALDSALSCRPAERPPYPDALSGLGPNRGQQPIKGHSAPPLFLLQGSLRRNSGMVLNPRWELLGSRSIQRRPVRCGRNMWLPSTNCALSRLSNLKIRGLVPQEGETS